MSQSPLRPTGSRSYKEGWRAVNQLIREGGSWSGRERNVAYRNLGDGRFEDVSYVAGLDFSGDGRAQAAFDFDHDGRMDMALSFRTGPRLRLLRNEHKGPETSLVLELRGTRSNRDAVGAWVTLHTDRRVLHRHVRSGSGFLSQSTRRVHFGLSLDEKPEILEVAWPSGSKQRITAVPRQGLFVVIEDGALTPLQARVAPVASVPEKAAKSLWLAAAVPAPETIASKGRWTLVSFYADWCPPCRAELAEWKSHTLPLQIINVDETPMAAWNAFRRQLFDYREDLALPTSFLVDAKGRVAKLYRGLTLGAHIKADLIANERPALPFAGTWLSPPPERNYAEMAVEMAEAGLLAQAAQYFAMAQPGDEARVNYATLLMEQKQTAKAETLFREILAGNPGHPEALANLGLLLLEKENFDQAAELLERLRSVQPADAAAAEWLGMARIGQGRLPEAIRALEDSRQLGRESADLLNHLAILYAETGRREEAISLFRSALARYPDHVGLTANLRRLTQ